MDRGAFPPALDVASGELAAQLLRLVEQRIVDPAGILFGGDGAVTDLRVLAGARVAEWAERLLGADEARATGLLARLIGALYPSDGPFDPPPEWWRTPLGRVTALRVGHPGAVAVPYAVAGAMLGITRQGVHDLITRGKLCRHPDGGVLVASVRQRLGRVRGLR